jgi:hypothetical protein
MGLAASVCFLCARLSLPQKPYRLRLFYGIGSLSLFCHCRDFNICSSLAACARMFLSGGNPRLLKNSFYDEVCRLLVCHSRVFNICSSLAACARVFLSGGNPRLLKNSVRQPSAVL